MPISLLNMEPCNRTVYNMRRSIQQHGGPSSTRDARRTAREQPETLREQPENSQRTAILHKSTNQDVSVRLPEALIHNTSQIVKPLWNHNTTICLLTLIPNQMLHMPSGWLLWMCPVCSLPVWSELTLVVDGFFLRLLLPSMNHRISVCVCLPWTPFHEYFSSFTGSLPCLVSFTVQVQYLSYFAQLNFISELSVDWHGKFQSK